jgi:hypothetical protein
MRSGLSLAQVIAGHHNLASRGVLQVSNSASRSRIRQPEINFPTSLFSNGYSLEVPRSEDF